MVAGRPFPESGSARVARMGVHKWSGERKKNRWKEVSSQTLKHLRSRGFEL